MGRILNKRNVHSSLLQVHFYIKILPGAALNANVQMCLDHSRLLLNRAAPIAKSVDTFECEARIFST